MHDDYNFSSYKSWNNGKKGKVQDKWYPTKRKLTKKKNEENRGKKEERKYHWLFFLQFSIRLLSPFVW